MHSSRGTASFLLLQGALEQPRKRFSLKHHWETNPMTSRIIRHASGLALIVTSIIAGCGGSGSDGGNAPTTSDVAVRFSDAPVEELSRVVITVDAITFDQQFPASRNVIEYQRVTEF